LNFQKYVPSLQKTNKFLIEQVSFEQDDILNDEIALMMPEEEENLSVLWPIRGIKKELKI